jgi:hypothetical protein
MVSLQGKVVSATLEGAVGSVVRLRLNAPIEGDDLGAAAMQLVLAQRLGIIAAGVSHLVCVTHDVPVVQKSTRQTMLVVLGARPPADGDPMAQMAVEEEREKSGVQLRGREGEMLLSIAELGEAPGAPLFKARVDDLCFREYGRGAGVMLCLDLADATGTIRAVAFNASARRLKTQLRAGDDILVRGGRLKRVEERFRRQHNFELTLDERAVVDVH